MLPSEITFSLFSISSSKTLQTDKSGQLLLKEVENFGGKIKNYQILPDNQKILQENFLSAAKTGSDFIISTGGTGCTPDDVTPEATRNVISSRLEGVETAIMNFSLEKTKFAMLSRLVAGIIRLSENETETETKHKGTVIINFPGSSKAIGECFSVIKPIICHLVDQVKNIRKDPHYHEKKADHKKEDTIPNQKTEPKSDCNCFLNESLIPDSQGIVKSKYPMIELNEAQEIIKNEISKIVTHRKCFLDVNLIGMKLAEDIFSSVNVPSVRTSKFDGYALCGKNAESSKSFEISGQTFHAGAPADSDTQGNAPQKAYKISTGGMLPKNTPQLLS